MSCAPHAVALDPPGERLEHADHALEQRRLAGAVGADHRGQRAALDRAVEMMHRRVAVIAEREIAELQLRGHGSPHGPERRGPEHRDHARPPWRAAPAPTAAGSTDAPLPADARAGMVVMMVVVAVVVVCRHGKCYNITYRFAPDRLSHSNCENIRGRAAARDCQAAAGPPCLAGGWGFRGMGRKSAMSDQKSRVVAVGEVMVEMARGGDGRFGHGCGGDTFNTAVYLARAGVDVAYATALGDDPYSDGIVSLAPAEGVKTDLMLRVPGRQPGLYLIETDPKGERTLLLLARHLAGARTVRTRRTGAAIAESLLTARADLFLRHHAVALLQHRARPFPRDPRAGAQAGRARSPSTATSGRAAGRATCRAPAPCSSRRSSASMSRCRPTTTRRCCGATRARRPRSSGCRRSASARSW